MIDPRSYSPAAVERLRQYLMDELATAEADRKEKEEEWIECHEAYWAQPIDEPETMDFPFHGSANLVVPIIATDVETVFARMMGLLFEPDALFSIEASMPEMGFIAPRVEEFMKWSQKNEIDWQGPIGDWLLEILKLGTGILKVRYNREVKKVHEWRELDQGTYQQQAVILLKDAPSVHRVPLFDYYVPSGFRHQKELPWCCEEVFLTWRKFQNRVAAGIYQARDQVTETSAVSSGGKVQSELDRISGFKQARGNKLRLLEFWTDWDITGGQSMDCALVCTIHRDSGQYVRLDYNPFFNQEPPYEVARFMRDENNFYGFGLGKMGINEQEEITAMHNQRIDSGTVANSFMTAVRKDNTDVTGDEKVYPGKTWRLNDPAKDIQLLTWGSANAGAVAGSIAAEQETLRYHQTRTGVNDWMFAQQNQTTAYGAAFTNQQIGNNATRRQGEFLRELRNALSGAGTYVLELYQQFNQRGKEFYALGAQDGQLVRMVLQFPLDLIRRGLKVNVTAVDVAGNKDARIRNNMIAMQSLMQYYQQVMQALQIAGNPQLPQELRQTALDMIRGLSRLMHEVLDAHGQQEAQKMLPQIAGILDAQQQQLAGLHQLIQGAGQQRGGGAPMAPGYGQQPGMGAVPGAGFPNPGALPPTAPPVGLPSGIPQGAGSPGF